MDERTLNRLKALITEIQAIVNEHESPHETPRLTIKNFIYLQLADGKARTIRSIKAEARRYGININSLNVCAHGMVHKNLNNKTWKIKPEFMERAQEAMELYGSEHSEIVGQPFMTKNRQQRVDAIERHEAAATEARRARPQSRYVANPGVDPYFDDARPRPVPAHIRDLVREKAVRIIETDNRIERTRVFDMCQEHNIAIEHVIPYLESRFRYQEGVQLFYNQPPASEPPVAQSSPVNHSAFTDAEPMRLRKRRG